MKESQLNFSKYSFIWKWCNVQHPLSRTPSGKLKCSVTLKYVMKVQITNKRTKYRQIEEVEAQSQPFLNLFVLCEGGRVA